MPKEPLSGVLEQDGASKYLEGLTDQERRPQYIMNGLAKSPETFSEEEREAAQAICSPAAIVNAPQK
jgi:hypothetical protein